MKELLAETVRESAALFWVCFAGPWIARLCGIPLRATFWTMAKENPRVTRTQFVWAFGVCTLGVGLFLFSLDSGLIQQIYLQKSWNATLGRIGFSLALSIFMGVVVAFWCAPTQIGEPAVTELKISEKNNLR